ncbi:MAG TPA: PilZ domain-containing protein [Gemmataceae bacterium]|nr:PilZ domain-containing protein [Gemmataceae bacterium]
MPRYDGRGIQAYLCDRAAEYVWPMRVLDLSQGGISLVTNHRLPLGTTATLKLYNPVPNFWCTCQVQVVYAIKQADGRFRLGGRFVADLSDAELALLCGANEPGQAVDPVGLVT